jgi:glycosyltransferase involved in cell wall biosynthesis
LFAHIFVFLLRKKSITKYAGYFSFFEGERIPSIIERNFIKKILRPPHYALVYGPSPSSHLISFIPAAISRTEISALKELRREKKEQKAKLVFYSLGKLIPVKYFDLAIHGFGLFFQGYPSYEWEYHLIGDGVELDNLVELCKKYGISNRVFFEGKLSYEDAMRKLVSADMVIMPGRKEGWPKVVIEGWAVGAVPLVVEAGISSLIIKDKVNGFLFKPEPNALKEQLVAIFKATNSLSEIRKTCWEEVEHFSMEEFSKGIEDICRNKLKL